LLSLTIFFFFFEFVPYPSNVATKALKSYSKHRFSGSCLG